MRIPTALRDEDLYVRRLGVGRAAAVVARVRGRSTADGQRALCLRPGRCNHAHASRRIVVDHARVVIPEHVLRRHWAL